MTRRYNILYVDDEKDNLFAFKSVFRRYYNIFTAEGGDEAIEMLKQENFDLVISDQRMPKMTGVELCEYVQVNHPNAKRMIVTGYSEKEPIDRALEQGWVSTLIMKPWSIDELKETMERLILE